LKRRGTDEAPPGNPVNRLGFAPAVAIQVHAQLQELLRDELVVLFGKKRVILEENFVDVKCNTPSGKLFFEIKADPAPRRAIRAAIGQLLAYSYHAEKHHEKIRGLIVAGPG